MADTALSAPLNSWPTREQIVLLRSALLEDAVAIEAWDRWRASIDLAQLDHGSARLLPLLARNLRRWGIRDPLLDRFDGVRRHVWVTNQLQIAQMAPVVRALGKVGIRTMLLGGAALASRPYTDLSLRPMDDLDLLVPTADARRAMDLLRGLGWRSRAPAPEAYVPVADAHPFVDGAGRQLQLHWHVLRECCEPNADDDFWADAEPAMLGDAPTLVLGPADLFLHVVVHGLSQREASPVGWIADAMTIITATGVAFAWTRLVEQARKRALILPVRAALSFLDRALGAPVPREVLARLRDHRASMLERLEFRFKQQASPRLGALPLLLCHHARLSREAGIVRGAWRFPGYLQHALGLPTMRELPGALGARILRRLRPSTRA